MRKFRSTYPIVMADHLMNNSVSKNGAATYGHSRLDADNQASYRHSECQLQKTLLGIMCLDTDARILY